MADKRKYADRRFEAGVTQLSWETKDEKRGEFGEALKGNTEPSLISLYKSRIKKV